ncbi:MAG: methionyl-tRNA formyltransferase [Epulopiscium sp. Nele67-Bin005]|nr:MAG: methionyl-tRNA formyltransferase [Epulopiscium sp. Nele67-Bin005]
MKVVFMGTPDFAVPTLQMLIDNNHEIGLVFTQPDRPKGRGNKVIMSPVKELALKYNLEVMQPQRLKAEEDCYTAIKNYNPDIIIVVAFGQILPESILNIPKRGCINVHGSLLPKYRGAGPIQWSIIEGEKVTGVTIMYMDKGLDTGDMLYKKEIIIEETDTAQTLHDKMMVVGAIALEEALPLIENNTLEREIQNHDKSTYAPMLNKELAKIKWENSASSINNLIRGLNPWPVGYTLYNNQPLKIYKATIKHLDKTAPIGTILSVDKEGILVQTGDGQLLIEEMQLPNKKRMLVSEYIKGNSILAGEILC